MQALLFFITCATIIAIGESVQCYNCVEAEGDHIPGLKKCVLPFSSNDNNQKCIENGYCMKGTGNFDGHTIVMRQCIPVKDIPNFEMVQLDAPTDPIVIQFGGVRVTANICDKDLCNAATIPNARYTFAVLIFSIILLFV